MHKCIAFSFLKKICITVSSLIYALSIRLYWLFLKFASFVHPKAKLWINGRRAVFDKVHAFKALEKRPVASDQIENAVQEIKDAIRKIGEREVPSQILGKQVMNKLKELDQVAYVRFASVYQNFQDIKDFADEISELSKK